MKLSATPMLENPRKNSRRAAKKSPRKKQRYATTRTRPFLIEAMQQHRPTKGWVTGLRFLYWDGRKWITSTRSARHYATRSAAEKEARAIIKHQHKSIRFVRVMRE